MADDPLRVTKFFGVTRGIMWTLLISTIVLVIALRTYLTIRVDPQACEMTYMRPSYVPMLGFGMARTRFGRKYALYLYREDAQDVHDEPSGTPVLFVPGNAGSYKQVRSIASKAATEYALKNNNNNQQQPQRILPLDFFTVDFNEEFSGMHGGTLLDQAEYLNDAIRYILKDVYPNARARFHQSYPLPTSVIVIGHSMGGFVARTLLATHNYLPGSVNTIITMASPHLAPPAAIDRELTLAYETMNAFWSNDDNLRSVLHNVSIVSLAGGVPDKMVSSELSTLSGVVSANHGLSVFTTAIPDAWVSADHQCIIWCYQIVRTVVDALFAIVDARKPSQTIDRPARLEAWKQLFVTGSTYPLREHSLSSSSDIMNKTFLWTDVMIVPNTHTHRLHAVQTDTNKDPFIHLITSFNIRNYKNAVRLFGCSSFPHDCEPLVSEFTMYPLKRVSNSPPFLHAIRYFVATVTRPRHMKHLLVQFTDEFFQSDGAVFLAQPTPGPKPEVFTFSSLDVLMGSRKSLSRSIRNQAFLQIQLAGIYNSLFMYTFSIHRSECAEKNVPLMVRQSFPKFDEVKYWIDDSEFTLGFHAHPFHRNYISQDGIHLTILNDHRCPIQTISLRLDLAQTISQVIKKYPTSLIVLPFSIMLQVFSLQIRHWHSSGQFSSFGRALSFHFKYRFFSDMMTLLFIFFIRDQFLCDTLLLASSSICSSSILFGPQNTWFLLPLVSLWSVGALTLVYFLVSVLVRLVSLGRRLLRLRQRGEHPHDHVRRKVVTLIVLAFLVTFYVPHQFVFLVALFVLLMTAGKTHASTISLEAYTPVYKQAYYQFLLNFQVSVLMMFVILTGFNVPVLMVWLKNLSVWWFLDTDHNVLMVAPFISVALLMKHMIPCRTTPFFCNVLPKLVLKPVLIYITLFGIRYVYQLYFAAWVVMVFVLVQYIDKSVILWLDQVLSGLRKIGGKPKSK